MLEFDMCIKHGRKDDFNFPEKRKVDKNGHKINKSPLAWDSLDVELQFSKERLA